MALRDVLTVLGVVGNPRRELKVHRSQFAGTLERINPFTVLPPHLIEVATITGHRDLRMLKRYTHPRASDLARRLDAQASTDEQGPPPSLADALRRHLPPHKTIDEVAGRFGIPADTLSDLLAGQARIDVGLALKLERLGPSAQMWLNVQSAYDLRLQRHSPDTRPQRVALRVVANNR